MHIFMWHCISLIPKGRTRWVLNHFIHQVQASETLMMQTMAATTQSKSYFPLAGSANDGWSTESEATATCFCGAVQLAFVSPHNSPFSQIRHSDERCTISCFQ